MSMGFFAKTEAQLRAEQALIDAEDRLLAYDPEEAEDLGYHSKRDADRTKVIVARQRLTHEMVKAASHRNVVATLAVGLILMAKGIIPLDPVAWGQALQKMFMP